MDALRSIRRLMLKTGLFPVIILSLAFSHTGWTEELPELPLSFPSDEPSEEVPGELLNLGLGDSSVSLRLYGRWKGTLNAGIGFAHTPFGVEALTGDEPFFTQEGDLTLSLWMLNRWFLEASFMDDSALNTYRLGYQGLEGDVIRYIGAGNTGLDFPSFPYLDLGGDSPSSFGLYGNAAVGSLAIHSLFRYDAAAREERVFIGNRERSFSFKDLSRPQRGVSFILPDKDLNSAPEIFIQDNAGGLTGSDGKRWRRALAGEYAADTAGRVMLTLGAYTGGITEPETSIAVAYSKGADNSPWTSSMGTYDDTFDPLNPDRYFLAAVQVHFDPSKSLICLWDYPQSGQGNPVAGSPINNIPGTVIIDGVEALVIFEPGTFSPFEKQNRYLAPVSTSASAELVKLSTGDLISGFRIIPLEDIFLEALILNPEQRLAQRGVYEMVSEEPGRDNRSVKDRWPLGDLYPELYLPGRSAFTGDIGIRFTNYSAEGAFSIGTDVVPGSVQVYRNGILDPNFSYIASSGTIILSNPAGFSEVIRITYLRQSLETRLGSLAAGIGAIWNSEGPFSWKLGIGLRWNVSSGEFSENGATSPGTAGLGAEAKWDYERLRAGLTLGLGFEQPDTAGLYRAAGMEDSEWSLPLPPETSFISEAPNTYNLENRSDLVYRNYRSSSILTGTSLANLENNAEIIEGRQGPYPAMHSETSSQVLVAEFRFTESSFVEAEKNWTGFETPLGFNAEYLEKAEKIEVPYRFMNFSRTPLAGEITVIFQMGALADKDSGNPENPNLIMQKQIYMPGLKEDSNPDIFDHDIRIATIQMDDTDRSKLQGAKYLRILILWDDIGTNGSLNGRLVLMPPIVRGANWRPVIAKGNEIRAARNFITGEPEVKAVEEPDLALGLKYSGMISRLHSESGRQRILEISWNGPGAFSNDGAGPGADGRLPSIPLLNYSSLSFFIRRPLAAANTGKTETHPDQVLLNSGTLRFIIGSGPDSLKNSGEIALMADVPLEALRDTGAGPGEWTRVDIKYRGSSRQLLINGDPVPGALVTYNSSAAAKNSGGNAENTEQGSWNSSYAAFLLIPDPGNPFPDGNVAIDEIFLEDPVPSYRLNNGASVEWTRPGSILKIRDKTVISDVYLQSAIETGAQGNPFDEEKDGHFGMNGRGRAEISILGARLTGNYSYSLSSSQNEETGYTWTAGHSLSRSFGPLSIRESFDNAPADRTMNHRLALSLNARIRGDLSWETVYESEMLRRRWYLGSSGKPSEKLPLNFSADASAVMNVKSDPEENKLFNYGAAWINSFGYLLPDSGSDAENREILMNFRAGLETMPVGSEVFFRLDSLYSSPDDISQAGSLLRLDLPINPGGSNIRLNFRMEREYRRNVFATKAGFLNDWQNWADSFSDAASIMFSLPFYSLFAPNQDSRMDKFGSINSINIAQFADRYELSLQKAQAYGLSSFFLPRRFTFRTGRLLERKLETPRDTLSFGTGLGFSSINMFGAMGAAPLFGFYQNDEFSHSLDAQLSFPKNEKVSWGIRSDQAMSFHALSGSELALNNTLTINSSSRIGEGSRWTNNLLATWIVPMESSLLGRAYDFLIGMAGRQASWLTLANIAKLEYDLLRMETLEFVMERVPSVSEGDYFRFSVVAGHESVVRIFGKLNLSVFAKIKLSEDFNTNILSFLGTIGTSLYLMF